jgi:hypothetical protein
MISYSNEGRMSVEKCKQQKYVVTNPRYGFTHDIFTAGDIEQFNVNRTRKDLIFKEKPDLIETNIFGNVKSELIWEKFKNIDSRAVFNTFLYLFNKLKKGIFIRIANNKLESFIPFSNVQYKNEFADLIKVDETKFKNINELINFISKLQNYQSPQIRPVSEWFANNALFRYDYTEGDHNVLVLFDLLNNLCSSREVPDIEFFINRRDFPQIKVDGTEPYNHIFGNIPLKSHNYEKYAPIFSFSGNSKYADILLPTYEDWARAINQEKGLVFPKTCREYPKTTNISWKDKIEKAVFRGSSTGAGVSNGKDNIPGKINQRLAALRISSENPSLLDVGITKWNLRPRKLENVKFLQTISPQGENKNYKPANKLSLQEQSKFKYILNLEGNVCAYRLSYELSSGSVILIAKSEWNMWFQKFLKPYIHFVPVREDLEDLIEKIQWCISHDKECKKIVKNANLFYESYLNSEAILDFFQKQLWDVSSVSGIYEYIDLFKNNIKEEKKLLLKIFESEWNKKPIQYSNVNFECDRCIGYLDGLVKRFRNSTLNGPVNKIKKNYEIFKNVNGNAVLFNIENFKLVGKKANNKGKIKEHIHENYIGIKAINSIISKIPNFCYTFGPLKDEKKMVFTEFIPGITMFEWLKSPYYNFKQFVSILTQINLALFVAQNSIGFVHFDLYPWNIIISKPQELYRLNIFPKISYVLNEKSGILVLNIQPELIPVIIDYGKSRAIVFEDDDGLIDRCFSNMYKHGSIQDTLSILYGSLNVIKNIGPKEQKLFLFPEKLGLDDFRNVKRWSKFGALFNFTSEPNSPQIEGISANPKHFVDFLLKVLDIPDRPVIGVSDIKNGKFKYSMEKGINPIILDNFMKSGNKINAIQEFIKYVNHSRSPQKQINSFFRKFQSNLIKRNIEWVDLEISKSTVFIENQWKTVRKVFDVLIDEGKSNSPHIDFPQQKEIYFDEEITKNEIKLQSLDDVDCEDWISISSLCLDAYLFQICYVEKSFEYFIKNCGFKFLNEIASKCTVKKISKLSLKTNNK